MSISVDSVFPITGSCVTNIGGTIGQCSGGRRKFMTWVHTPVADPAAIVVMLAWQDGSSDKEKDAEITYGDKHLMLRAQLARNATGMHDGAVSIYALTSEQGIPTGPQRIRVNFKDDSNPRIAISLALVCAADRWIALHTSGKHEGPGASPSVTLAAAGGEDLFALAGLYFGKSSPNLADATPNAGFTRMDAALPTDGASQTAVVDFIRANGMGGGAPVTIGWALNAAGDSVGVVAAGFKEVAIGTEVAGRIPFVAGATHDGGFGNIHLPSPCSPTGIIKPGMTCLVLARNGGGATIPTLAPGFSAFASGVDGHSKGWRIAYRLLEDTDNDIGPWTNADTITVLVYDGAGVVRGSFTGTYATVDGSGTSFTYPALTRSVASRRGWIVSVAAYGQGGTTSYDKARKDRRKDMVAISSEFDAEFVAVAHTPLPADSIGTDASTMTGPAGAWTAFAIELFSDWQIIGTPGPWVWEITEGALPDGLTLNTNTGKVTGTPTKPGTFKFKYLVKNNFQVLAEQSCAVQIVPEASRKKTRDVMLLGMDNGAVMVPDVIEDFSSALSAEENVTCAVRGKAYAPAGTDGEVIFRRLYVSGYHRAAIGLWIVPVIDGRPQHDLRTWFHRPAPASGVEERFHALVELGREDPDFPGVMVGLRGSIAEVYIETADPENRIHLETAAWVYELLNQARIRQIGEANPLGDL